MAVRRLRMAALRGGPTIINEDAREAWMLEVERYRCPWCDAPGEALLDLSGGDQCYVEDCAVCCQPIVFELRTDGVEWRLELRREGD
jgi:hypothetical protein